MKKILLSIFFAFCFFVSFGQGIINRSGASVTVSDARLQAQFNFYAPRYADTTAANLAIGIDSCGAQIYTYDVNWYWIRQCSPKRWSQLPTVNGGLVSNVTIVDSNHIAICNINSCDTIQVNGVVGPITNITVINNTTLVVCGSDQEGSELITNGGFTGSATGWTLGTLWAYGTNDIAHSFGSTATSFQGGGLVEGGTYVVELEVNGGTVGTVAVSLDAGTSQTYNPDVGAVSFTGTWSAGINSKINFAPSNDFDGNITNVSVKQLLPNCDTLQIIPTNFTDSIRIYVITPIRAANDSTFYITQAGPSSRGGDSGYLSTAGYDTFVTKVDTIYYASNGSTVDTLKYDAGDLIGHPFYINDVQNGLISGGQVSWSGFGLAYTVEQAIYRINGVRYTSPPTVITLDDADATDPRIDAIGVDSSGNAVYLPGTAEANPVVPQVDNFYQIFLTSILVPALATVAPIDTVIIYNENVPAPTEWTPITNSGTTTDPDNTLNVYRGSKSINVTNINAGDSIVFTSASPIDLSAYQAVVFFIKLKQVIPAAVATQIRAQFTNGSTFIGGIINVPIDKTNITTYQAISIPLSVFNFTSTIATKFKLTYSSGNATVNQGFFIDFVYLQNGVTPTTPPDATQIVAYNGLTHFKNNNIDSIRLGGTLNQNTTITAAGFYTAISGGRFEIAQGANVVAANDLTLGNDGNLFITTGNTQINAITTANWQAGSTLTMIFTGTPTVKNNTAGGAGTAPFILAGATDFAAAANDVLTVIYDGTNWYEQSRKIASSSGVYTANNGLTMTANNTVLGGTLLSNRTITSAGFTLTLNDAVGSANTLAINTPTGGKTALVVTASGNSTGGVFLTGTGTAVTAQASGSGTGLTASTSTGFGANIAAVDGVPILITNFSNSTNTVSKLLHLSAETLGTPANGIGGSINFYNETSTTAGNISNSIVSKLVDVANATRTSQLIITGVNSAVAGDIVSFEGNKRTMLYGRIEPQQGVDVASAAGAIAVGLDGNVFELTGTAAVTLISNLNWVNGSEITLVFTSTATLTNATATSGTDITILLAGAANFTGSANDVVKLVLSEVGGTQAWREVSRSVN